VSDRCFVVLIVFRTVLCCAGSVLAAPTYKVVDLGRTFPGDSYATGINAKGQVIGYWTDWSTYGYSFLYDHGTVTNLGKLPGTSSSEPYSINSNGQIVGDSGQQAFFYSNGTMENLGGLGGSRSAARCINTQGQVVGWSYTSGGAEHAYLYADGSMNDLGTLGGSYSYALGINDEGDVVGGAMPVPQVNSHAFVYRNRTMTDLGTLNGDPLDASNARAINNAGQIVGSSQVLVGKAKPNHAFLYSNGAMTDLGVLPSYETSYALDLNLSGQVVGYAQLPKNGDCHAFVYEGGVMTDLNTLIDPSSGWTLQVAQGINDSGCIVGYGSSPNGISAFLLTPIPEPSTLALLGIGILGLLAYAWRRRKS
jgi:probable HAF family extracellular repeat protein